MFLRVNEADGRVTGTFPTAEDAEGNDLAGCVLVDEAELVGAFEPGCSVIEGAIVPDLDLTRVAAREAIDQSAGEFRRQYLTAIPGQETIYTLKAEQAAAFLQSLSGGTATADPELDYLFAEALACSGEATVQTMTARAQIIASAAAQTAIALPYLEAERVARKEAVIAAGTKENIQALAVVDWAAVLAAALPGD